jgi:putative hydrolase of the HAD superfamily
MATLVCEFPGRINSAAAPIPLAQRRQSLASATPPSQEWSVRRPSPKPASPSPRHAKISAVLFDAAGTLLFPSEPVGETYARLARTFGAVASAERIETAFRATFRRMPPMAFPDQLPDRRAVLERDWWRDLVAATFSAAGAAPSFRDFEACFNALFEHFADAAAWRVLPGTHQALAALRGRGIRTGIVSNFDHRLGAILGGLALTPLLDIVVLPSAAGVAKPHAGIFQFALRQLRVPPGETIYIGDDVEHDVEGARAAGLNALDITAVMPLSEIMSRLQSLQADLG